VKVMVEAMGKLMGVEGSCERKRKKKMMMMMIVQIARRLGSGIDCRAGTYECLKNTWYFHIALVALDLLHVSYINISLWYHSKSENTKRTLTGPNPNCLVD